MGYEVHIKRRDGGRITIEELYTAAAEVPGIRPATRDALATNPQTGEEIRIPTFPGDMEVFLQEFDAWSPCLRYSQNRISCKAGANFLDATSPIRQAMVAIASALDAVVVGDDGTVFS